MKALGFLWQFFISSHRNANERNQKEFWNFIKICWSLSAWVWLNLTFFISGCTSHAVQCYMKSLGFLWQFFISSHRDANERNQKEFWDFIKIYWSFSAWVWLNSTFFLWLYQPCRTVLHEITWTSLTIFYFVPPWCKWKNSERILRFQ